MSSSSSIEPSPFLSCPSGFQFSPIINDQMVSMPLPPESGYSDGYQKPNIGNTIYTFDGNTLRNQEPHKVSSADIATMIDPTQKNQGRVTNGRSEWSPNSLPTPLPTPKGIGCGLWGATPLLNTGLGLNSPENTLPKGNFIDLPVPSALTPPVVSLGKFGGNNNNQGGKEAYFTFMGNPTGSKSSSPQIPDLGGRGSMMSGSTSTPPRFGGLGASPDLLQTVGTSAPKSMISYFRRSNQNNNQDSHQNNQSNKEEEEVCHLLKNEGIIHSNNPYNPLSDFRRATKKPINLPQIPIDNTNTNTNINTDIISSIPPVTVRDEDFRGIVAPVPLGGKNSTGKEKRRPQPLNLTMLKNN